MLPGWWRNSGPVRLAFQRDGASCSLHLRKEILNQRLDLFPPLLKPLSWRKPLQFGIRIVEHGDLLQCLIWPTAWTALGSFCRQPLRHRQKSYGNVPSNLNSSRPAALVYQMVLLETVGYQDAFVILVELQRIFVIPCLSGTHKSRSGRCFRTRRNGEPTCSTCLIGRSRHRSPASAFRPPAWRGSFRSSHIHPPTSGQNIFRTPDDPVWHRLPEYLPAVPPELLLDPVQGGRVHVLHVQGSTRGTGVTMLFLGGPSACRRAGIHPDGRRRSL